MNYERIADIGIITFFISGIIILCLLISGNAHSSVSVLTLFGKQSILKSNPIFDYAVLFNFISILVFGTGKIGGSI